MIRTDGAIKTDPSGGTGAGDGVTTITSTVRINDIGVPGTAGFGVGIAPAAALPPGMQPLSGYADPTHANFGNYVFADGSIMCWVPRFYYKVGTLRQITITGISQANPAVVTAAAHGLTTGQTVTINNVVGMTQVNDLAFVVTTIDANTFSLDGVNSTGYTAYSSAGAATTGNGINLNVIDVKGANAFANTAAANAAGYALHRAFIDGGAEQAGFFVDKYMASKNAWGTGYIASSLPNGKPLSTASAHNPIGDLTAVAGINYYYAALDAAKARDGVNGAKNASSPFFCSSRFITAALAILSMAHGQAAGNGQFCAWFDATNNFPKGCNNNALGDTNDATVKYVSDGYQNCALTGSGMSFAKTTHNGQTCGVADLNGLMYEINPGLTCVATTKTITGATQANPCVITIANHGYTTGKMVQITAVGGMTQLNDKLFTVTTIDANTFSLDGVNSTGYGAFTSGGTVTIGTFYVLKQAAAMKNVTSGNTLATDHWGATAAAAQFDAITMPFLAAAGGSSVTEKFGNAANQVLSEATSGDPWVLSGLGFPRSSAGISAAGTALFGTDYFYQYIINELVPISCLTWSNTTIAGVWGVNLYSNRSNTNNTVGFRLACYPAA